MADPSGSGDDLELAIHDVLVRENADGSLLLVLRTSRGDLPGMLHPCEGSGAAVVFLSGASGGIDGPADRIYARLAADVLERGITSLRLDYRQPNEFQECVLDALAALSFLRGVGADGLQLVGHSFGAAVAIKAAEIDRSVDAVAALSSQLFGTNGIASLAPRPLLVVHGLDDQVLEATAGKLIYERAGEPKRLVLYPGAGHGLAECKEELHQLLLDWLQQNAPARPAGGP